MAADRTRGEVDFTVGGKTYTLVLKTLGLMSIQQHFSTGDVIVDIDEVMQKAAKGSLEHVVALLWGSFLKYHPDVTLNQVIDMVDDAGGIEAVNLQLSVLGESTKPDAEDIAELKPQTANPPKAQTGRRGTGGRSNLRAAVPA